MNIFNRRTQKQDKFDENLNRDDNKLKCFCFCHFNNNNNHIDSICSLTRKNSGSTDGDSNSSFFSFKSEYCCNQCDACFLMDNNKINLKSSSISTSPTSMRSSSSLTTSSSSSLLLTSTINENYKVIIN